MRVLSLVLAMLGLLLVASSAIASDTSVPAVPENPGIPQERAAAQESADRFFALVDHRKEQEAWPEFGSLMRYAAGSLKDWQANLSAMQKDLGRPLSRKLLAMGFTSGLEGAPEGRYYVIHFSTTFERASALEEVVVVFESGKWRIAGYIVSDIKRLAPTSRSAPNNSFKPNPLRGSA